MRWSIEAKLAALQFAWLAGASVLAALLGRYFGDAVLGAVVAIIVGAVPVILVARRAARNPEAYEYLAESTRAWLPQEPLARTIQEVGWTHVQWRNLTGGLVAIHRGVKPSRSKTTAV